MTLCGLNILESSLEPDVVMSASGVGRMHTIDPAIELRTSISDLSC